MKKIAFFPYTINEVTYIHTMKELLETEYDVADYLLLKNGWYHLLDFDVIYLNWIEDSLDEKDRDIILSARTQGIRVIWVFHNKIQHDADNAEQCRENIRFLIENSTDIVIHSRESRKILHDYALQLKEEKIDYIPHPNYIGDYCGYLGSKQWDWANDEFVFAFLGRICPYKNIEILIQAFQQLHERQCSLFIAGRPINTKYAEKLEMLIDGNKNIKLFPHYIDDIEMDRYIAPADVIVAPLSLKSSMNSGTMLLAYSYGKTTITPDICMTEDFPQDLLYTYHYENDEEHMEQLTAQMRKAYLEGKEKNAQMGRKLRKLVARDYSKERVRAELVSLVQ